MPLAAYSLPPPSVLHMRMHNNSPLLRVRNLGVRFTTDSLVFDAVSGVDFDIHCGQIFCLVGESGCGKSLTAKSLLQLLPENAALSGQAWLGEDEIFSLPLTAMRPLRGHRMSMIFQEPMTALNPVLRVGQQVMEPLRLHLGLSKAEARQRCVDLFRQVGIPAPQSRLDDYPHQLSGGMRQRVMIAMALGCEPQLLLADEPTTALDVTIQWQILQLIQHLAEERGMGVLLITHDLGVVAQTAHAVGVMYAGRMVERGPAALVLGSPAHPYTRGLMRSAPSRDSLGLTRLPVIPGSVPPPGALPKGCAFHPRCPEALPLCAQKTPPLCMVGSDGSGGSGESGESEGPEGSGGSDMHQACCWLHHKVELL